MSGLRVALALIETGIDPRVFADPEIAAGVARLGLGPIAWSLQDGLVTVAMVITGMAVLATLVSNHKRTAKVLRAVGKTLDAAHAAPE